MADYENKSAPPNWVVRRVPRSNIKYLGVVDSFYYEPGTGKRFRSRKKAWAKYNETKNSNAVQTIVIYEGSTGVKKITESQKKEVEEFLKDAWMNLMNKGGADV